MPTMFPLRRLTALREARGWTQFMLAAQSGVSLSTVQRYESGGRSGQAGHVQALADALGCSVLDLYGLREAADEEAEPSAEAVG